MLTERYIQVNNSADLAFLASRDGFPLLEARLLELHQPDAHWVLQRSEAVVGYCSLWWRSLPDIWGERLGFIGHYNVMDSAAAAGLLNHAAGELAALGCTLAIAPIDGNTWRRYRLLSDRGTEPLFFLEPDNPDEWCGQFEAAGFGAIAHYSSALATDLTQVDPRLTAVQQRLDAAGVKIRPLALDQFDAELERIHALSLVAFQHNFLYSPISQAEFLTQYRQVRPYVQPELVLLAEQEPQLVGFLFAVPDLLQAQRGETVDTVIIKTVAVLPGRRYAGLGNVLVARVQAIAHDLGYRRAIHALMHDDNNSRNLSSRYAHSIRRYTLYARKL
ncbi:GNAT family N-acetyltransferase [Thermoleptolyngbya oregonensis NK1-22]|uniref:GNAT family N-acetyltransferase n=1 Tax=Thermoleptolyngbya oregonensis NK1-22 TaxID=2547457 RepID=A0AA96Y384_9CYAN|nr:GNAT family N-acetyltransferase [Thermoleptolyngbya oregonensis]WOB42246.1 GNAT family N-acetyltransferase [Thermoleptolyngbya oregonensis NK1-22]